MTGFAVGDLDTVWFGGLTGVHARLAVDGADAIAQRDIDEAFTSVFIARADAGIDPIADIDGLSVLAERSLTFGSESSTSGRLTPQSFLEQAGGAVDDLRGEPGFSGSHDATIELVAAGAFEVAAFNSQVWDDRVAGQSTRTRSSRSSGPRRTSTTTGSPNRISTIDSVTVSPTTSSRRWHRSTRPIPMMP